MTELAIGPLRNWLISPWRFYRVSIHPARRYQSRKEPEILFAPNVPPKEPAKDEICCCCGGNIDDDRDHIVYCAHCHHMNAPFDERFSLSWSEVAEYRRLMRQKHPELTDLMGGL